MNLTNCNSCGAVFNADFIPFPTENEMILEDGSVDTDKCEWCNDREGYVPFITCPVCKTGVIVS